MTTTKLDYFVSHSLVALGIICIFSLFKAAPSIYYSTNFPILFMTVYRFLPYLILINLVMILICYSVMHFALEKDPSNEKTTDRSIIGFLVSLLTETKLVILWFFLHQYSV